MITGPRYEYSRHLIREKIAELKNLTAPYGLTVRYAVKANPHPEILTMLNAADIHFDASSSYEVADLLYLGIEGEKISLSSQQSAHNLDALLEAKVQVTATSLRQLDLLLNSPFCPEEISIRVNPDYGSGHNNRTSTGGVNASFGIWYEYLPEALSRCAAKNVAVTGIHIHVGSGANPSVWGEVMERCLDVLKQAPDVTSLNIGGGFKIHRHGDEEETNLAEVMAVFSDKLISFFNATKRQIALEIEPGTYLIAHAGTLVAQVDDIVDTGKNGFTFLKLNTGMNDFLRTTMYGSQHRIEVINKSSETSDYVVVGHNCESGDIFTTKNYDSETLATRTLNKATVGDEVRIYDTGAYCASMRAKGYNSFPDAVEILVD